MNFTRSLCVPLDLRKTKLHIGPRVSQTGPQNEDLDYNVVPGRTGSTGGRIPARGWPDLAGKGARGDPCSPRVRFWCLDGSEVLPARGLGGAAGLSPPLPLFRRDGRRCWAMCRSGSFRKVMG